MGINTKHSVNCPDPSLSKAQFWLNTGELQLPASKDTKEVSIKNFVNSQYWPFERVGVECRPNFMMDAMTLINCKILHAFLENISVLSSNFYLGFNYRHFFSSTLILCTIWLSFEIVKSLLWIVKSPIWTADLAY